MRHGEGLTLIEVVVAVAIMAIGVLGAAQLQATSLRNTSYAQALNEVTRMARAEIELQRHTATVISDLDDGELAAPVPTVTFDCVSERSPGISSCVVEVEPCTIALLPDATLICGSGVLSPPAYRVIVDVAGRRDVTLTVSTLATGNYIAGAAGGQ